jgi:hypothetical protein
VKRGDGIQLPDRDCKQVAVQRLTESPCRLSTQERSLVEKTIADHCVIRGWHLYVVNCGTNHVHVVVAANRGPEGVRNQFKSWCTRKLKERQRSRTEAVRRNWLTERGSERYISDEESLEAAIVYVRDFQ